MQFSKRELWVKSKFLILSSLVEEKMDSEKFLLIYNVVRLQLEFIPINS
jgi:hypothetical protein